MRPLGNARPFQSIPGNHRISFPGLFVCFVCFVVHPPNLMQAEQSRGIGIHEIHEPHEKSGGPPRGTELMLGWELIATT